MLARTRHLQCNTMIERVASKSNTEIEMLEHKMRKGSEREGENIIGLVKQRDKGRRKRFNHFLWVVYVCVCARCACVTMSYQTCVAIAVFTSLHIHFSPFFVIYSICETFLVSVFVCCASLQSRPRLYFECICICIHVCVMRDNKKEGINCKKKPSDKVKRSLASNELLLLVWMFSNSFVWNFVRHSLFIQCIFITSTWLSTINNSNRNRNAEKWRSNFDSPAPLHTKHRNYKCLAQPPTCTAQATKDAPKKNHHHHQLEWERAREVERGKSAYKRKYAAIWNRFRKEKE